MDNSADIKMLFESPLSKIVMLVDEEITHDRRVLAALSGYHEAEILCCRSTSLSSGPLPIRVYVRGLFILLHAVVRGVCIWRILRRHFGLCAKDWTTGVLASLKAYFRAQRVAFNLRSRIDGARVIHANDLFCGLIATELSRWKNIDFIYDAHEVEFHRNRRNSWLRTAFDATVEYGIVRHAFEIRVVNVPIAALFQRVHGINPERLRVVPNNHFIQHSSDEPAKALSCGPLAFVYVGGGVRGRQLDKLSEGADQLGVPVHAFFIGNIPEVAIAGEWLIGPAEYEDELISLVASHRCAMWCCVDDVCLSYRLALPNKFFQALAVGIPVVVSAGTYLADLVIANNIGFVFDGSNLDKIVQEMRAEDFSDKLVSVRLFQKALASGSVRI